MISFLNKMNATNYNTDNPAFFAEKKRDKTCTATRLNLTRFKCETNGL
jgi:hypothetical protein